MAYLDNPTQPNNNQEDSQEQQLGGPQSTTIGGSSNSPSAPVAGTPANKTGPTSSGRFTNLQKYVQANKQFAKDQGGFGKVVGEEVGKVANPYKQKVQTAKQEFQSAAEQAKPTYTAQQDLETINTAGQSKEQADLDRVSEAIKNIQSKGQQAAYTGPTQIGQVQGGTVGEQDIEKGRQDLEAIANAAGASGGINRNTGEISGRFSLLQRLFNKPSYSRGQIGLDNSLLGSSGQAKDVANRAQQERTQFGQQLTAAQQAAQEAVQGGQQAAEAVRAQTGEAVGGLRGTVQSELEQRAAEFNAQEAARAALARDPNANITDLSQYADLAAGYPERASGQVELGSQLLQGLNIPREDLIKAFGTYNQSQADIQSIDPSRLGTLNILNRLSGQAELTPAQQAAQQGQYGLVNEGENAIGRQMDIIRSGIQPLQNYRTYAQNNVDDAVKALSGDLGYGQAAQDRMGLLNQMGIDSQAIMADADRVARMKVDPSGTNRDYKMSPGYQQAKQDAIRGHLTAQMGSAAQRYQQQQQDLINNTIQKIIASRGQ